MLVDTVFWGRRTRLGLAADPSLNRDQRLVLTGYDLEPAFDEALLVATTLLSRLWHERGHGGPCSSPWP